MYSRPECPYYCIAHEAYSDPYDSLKLHSDRFAPTILHITRRPSTDWGIVDEDDIILAQIAQMAFIHIVL